MKKEQFDKNLLKEDDFDVHRDLCINLEHCHSFKPKPFEFESKFNKIIKKFGVKYFHKSDSMFIKITSFPPSVPYKIGMEITFPQLLDLNSFSSNLHFNKPNAKKSKIFEIPISYSQLKKRASSSQDFFTIRITFLHYTPLQEELNKIEEPAFPIPDFDKMDDKPALYNSSAKNSPILSLKTPSPILSRLNSPSSSHQNSSILKKTNTFNKQPPDIIDLSKSDDLLLNLPDEPDTSPKNDFITNKKKSVLDESVNPYLAEYLICILQIFYNIPALKTVIKTKGCFPELEQFFHELDTKKSFHDPKKLMDSLHFIDYSEKIVEDFLSGVFEKLNVEFFFGKISNNLDNSIENFTLLSIINKFSIFQSIKETLFLSKKNSRRITSFPPILFLKMNYTSKATLTFSMIIDLLPILNENNSIYDSDPYILKAIIIKKGADHYFNYMQIDMTQKWYKIDNASIMEVSKDYILSDASTGNLSSTIPLMFVYISQKNLSQIYSSKFSIPSDKNLFENQNSENSTNSVNITSDAKEIFTYNESLVKFSIVFESHLSENSQNNNFGLPKETCHSSIEFHPKTTTANIYMEIQEKFEITNFLVYKVIYVNDILSVNILPNGPDSDPDIDNFGLYMDSKKLKQLYLFVTFPLLLSTNHSLDKSYLISNKPSNYEYYNIIFCYTYRPQKPHPFSFLQTLIVDPNEKSQLTVGSLFDMISHSPAFSSLKLKQPCYKILSSNQIKSLKPMEVLTDSIFSSSSPYIQIASIFFLSDLILSEDEILNQHSSFIQDTLQSGEKTAHFLQIMAPYLSLSPESYISLKAQEVSCTIAPLHNPNNSWLIYIPQNQTLDIFCNFLEEIFQMKITKEIFIFKKGLKYPLDIDRDKKAKQNISVIFDDICPILFFYAPKHMISSEKIKILNVYWDIKQKKGALNVACYSGQNYKMLMKKAIKNGMPSSNEPIQILTVKGILTKKEVEISDSIDLECDMVLFLEKVDFPRIYFCPFTVKERGDNKKDFHLKKHIPPRYINKISGETLSQLIIRAEKMYDIPFVQRGRIQKYIIFNEKQKKVINMDYPVDELENDSSLFANFSK